MLAGNISSFDCSEEIINGQIVILSFYVKQIQHPVPRKTMVFAYVASVNDTHIDGKYGNLRICVILFHYK